MCRPSGDQTGWLTSAQLFRQLSGFAAWRAQGQQVELRRRVARGDEDERFAVRRPARLAFRAAARDLDGRAALCGR